MTNAAAPDCELLDRDAVTANVAAAVPAEIVGVSVVVATTATHPFPVKSTINPGLQVNEVEEHDESDGQPVQPSFEAIAL